MARLRSYQLSALNDQAGPTGALRCAAGYELMAFFRTEGRHDNEGSDAEDHGVRRFQVTDTNGLVINVMSHDK